MELLSRGCCLRVGDPGDCKFKLLEFGREYARDGEHPRAAQVSALSLRVGEARDKRTTGREASLVVYRIPDDELAI